MSRPDWFLYRCETCKHVQVLSLAGGSLAECCGAVDRRFSHVQVAEITPWRRLDEVVGIKTDTEVIAA